LDEFQIIPHIIALASAYALALPIGWDREREARSAGLRTFPLVALASCGFIQATETLLASSPDGMARVVEGVIVGIGFIGGGAILKHDNTVHGTATAASLWTTGAVGAAVGLGSFDVAITITIFTFLTLKLLPLLKQEISPATEGEPQTSSKRNGPEDKRPESNRNKRKKSQPAGD
jgi:putative Mg2+ transporter-C (MgtC) family protein